MKTVLVTSSTADVLGTSEAKDWLRVTTTDEDGLIDGLVTAARQTIEEITNRKIMKGTYYAYYDDWPSGNDYDSVYLPYAPLVSVPTTAIEYTDSEGDTTTFSSSKWATDTASEPGRVVLDYDYDWPTETLHNNNPIRVKFTCGYSSKADSSIPEWVKTATKILVATWYENRESVIVLSGGQSVAEVPMSVKAILQPHRVWSI